MDQLDLDIDNYELKDILALFGLHSSFDTAALKTAKRVLVAVHPDKSGLEPKYFIFFQKAFKLIVEIHRIRIRKEIDYDTMTVERSTDEWGDCGPKRSMIERYVPTDDRKFNKWFNRLFDESKTATDTDDDGYGEWMSEKVDSTSDEGSMSMSEVIDSRKQKLRALVTHDGVIEQLSASSGYSEIGVAPQSTVYGGTVGGLVYDDLKRAYTETVVPVSDADHANRKQYSSVDELVRERSNVVSIPGKHESDMLLSARHANAQESDAHRIYQLAKESESADRQNDRWMTGMLRIG